MDEDHDPDTRIFVSGLPPNFDRNQLGAHFARRYQVTDATVVPDRRIGFVGFRNYKLARDAIKYFDKSYIRLSKISVEMARPVEHRQRGQFHQSKQPGSGSPCHAGFQPYSPVTVSNKRKREGEHNVDGEPLGDPTVASAETNGHQQASGSRQRNAPPKEQELSLDSRRDTSKTLDSKQQPTSQQGKPSGSEVEDPKQSLDHSEKKEKRRKKKEEKEQEKGKEGREGKKTEKKTEKKQKTKEKAKKSEGEGHLAAEAVKGICHKGSNLNVAHDEPARKRQKELVEGDADGKGGVEPNDDDDALDTTNPSTDQGEQHPPIFKLSSDKDWLRGKTSRSLDLLDETPPDATSLAPRLEEAGGNVANTHGVETLVVPDDSPADLNPSPEHEVSASSGRLFVKNIPFTTEESDVDRLFSKYGQLNEIRLIRDGAGSSRGIGYVQFADSDSAEHALRELDRRSFQGRLLHIEKTVDRKVQKLDDYEISQLPIKKQKALKRKIEAASSTFNWNSMYMNPNAVLASVADRLGVTKADLIDPSSTDAAVKQAHAETHVIQETKAYLTSNGVDLDAFKQRQRDDTVLLVKNFPFGTTAEELKSLLRPYGEIARFLLPSSGTTAIVQYSQPTEGIQAIRNLAYRNFKGTLLYLEKGPKNLFTKAPHGSISQSPATENSDETQGRETSDKTPDSTSSTVFVRNLNFTTTSSDLINAFSPLHGFLSAKVKTRVEPKRPREVLSMGFGFVEFGDSRQALAAVSAMNGHRLDKHELLVQVSRRGTDVAEEQRRKDNQRKAEAHKTKLIIKNVPFEATKKDLRSLLGAYGQIRSLKLPQKFDHTTRGFAFADFVTAKEAENAMEALRDTHLLGRRLVLEFADEESIDPEDELRAMESKVGKQTEMIHLKKMTDSGRNRFKVGGTEEDHQ